MAAKKFIRAALTALLTLALVVSVFPICAFALENGEETLASVESTEAVEADVDDDALAGSATDTIGEETEALEAESGEATEAVADTEGENENAEETSNADGADTAESTEETTPADDAKDKSGISTGTIVSIAIVVVIVVAAAAYCIKNKEKVAKFFRECKSEIKKIVWTPWKQVKKNAVVVIVIVLLCAVVIGVLDLAFSKGIIALGDLF